MVIVLQALESVVSFEVSKHFSYKLKTLLKGVVTTSTCSSVISTNTTYIRNPGYPSSYTVSSAGTCSYTINKVSTMPI